MATVWSAWPARPFPDTAFHLRCARRRHRPGGGDATAAGSCPSRCGTYSTRGVVFCRAAARRCSSAPGLSGHGLPSRRGKNVSPAQPPRSGSCPFARAAVEANLRSRGPLTRFERPLHKRQVNCRCYRNFTMNHRGYRVRTLVHSSKSSVFPNDLGFVLQVLRLPHTPTTTRPCQRRTRANSVC